MSGKTMFAAIFSDTFNANTQNSTNAYYETL